jgi:hypothetical protein
MIVIVDRTILMSHVHPAIIGSQTAVSVAVSQKAGRSEMIPRFSPFEAIWKDALDRMIRLSPSDEFTFIVNGERVSSTVCEAVVVSPTVSEHFETDSSIRTWTIQKSGITGRLFRDFLEFFRSDGFSARSSSSLSSSSSSGDHVSFLSICQLLGNQRLPVILLASYILNSPDTSSSSVSSGDPSIDYCSSHFLALSHSQLLALDKDILYRILTSPLLQIETEDQLLQKLIELGDDYLDLWGCIEARYLSRNSLTVFTNKMKFNLVTESIWESVIRCLNETSDSELPERRFYKTVWGGSDILTDFPSIFGKFWNKKRTLLYRGTRDGFGSGVFHTKCDCQRNTLTIILTTKGYVFGGFTPIAWDSSSGYKPDSTKESFVFSLISPRGKVPQKFALSNTNNAIYCNSSYGPTFGGGHDIYVASDADRNTNSNTNFGHSYVNNTGIAGQQVFAGEYNFQVKEIEVFSIAL